MLCATEKGLFELMLNHGKITEKALFMGSQVDAVAQTGDDSIWFISGKQIFLISSTGIIDSLPSLNISFNAPVIDLKYSDSALYILEKNRAVKHSFRESSDPSSVPSDAML